MKKSIYFILIAFLIAMMSITACRTSTRVKQENPDQINKKIHTIGENYGGGIVFYLYDSGRHGLIAATKDQSSSIRWCGKSKPITRARADGIGAGLINTAIIIANQGTIDEYEFAATVCNEYSGSCGGITYGDWYLPSKYELNLLFLQRKVVGGFTTYYYWSSTEFNQDFAWLQDFNVGNQSFVNKVSLFCVRAVRAF